jgi:phosphonate transport system ATP-binding protein
MSEMILKIRNLSKTYPDGVKALKKINLDIIKGEFVIIVGPSGAGKSTLVRLINHLIEPTCGEIIFLDKDTVRAKGKEIRHIRRQIGMIFQAHNLVKRSSTIQNVLHGRLGYMDALRGGFGIFSRKDVETAFDILDRVGLKEQAYKRADELSGGQQQRVGIARAIIQKPKLIMADEPIASLDPTSSDNVMNYLKTICEEDGITVLVNLHQVEFAKKYASRIIGIKHGEIVFDGKPAELDETSIENIYS